MSKGQGKGKRANLSKSQYMKGLKSERDLWEYRHRRSSKGDFNSSAKKSSDTTWTILGKQVGAEAQRYYKGGVLVEADYRDVEAAVEMTEGFVDDGKSVIYEAAAIHPKDGSYASMDILRKVRGKDEWDLIEVKSSTRVKPEYINDLAFQYRVFSDAGYKIRSASIMHINNRYVRDGEIDPKKLFKVVDVTEKVAAKYDEVAENVARLNKMLASEKPPADDRVAKFAPSVEPQQTAAKPAEDKPSQNAGIEWGFGSLKRWFNRITGQAAPEVVKEADVVEAPFAVNPGKFKYFKDEPGFSVRYATAVEEQAHKQKQPHADAEKFGEFLDDLVYPIYYLDYETVMSPIPLYDGTRPYQQVPFQFSLHIQKTPGGELEHVEFLHQDQSDPRKAFTEALVKACGKKGSVIVYNQSFEETRNKEMAAAFPEHAKALEGINARMVDLLVPFRNRWLYHPEQEGSASLKKVLPAWTDVDYADMGIDNGADAQDLYRDFVNGNMTDAEEKELFENLIAYCEKDTYAMVALIERMEEIRDAQNVVSLYTEPEAKGIKPPEPF